MRPSAVNGYPLIPIVLGSFLGLLIVLDPIIANTLADSVDKTINNINIFKVYPYEVTSLFFASLLPPLLIKRFFSWVAHDTEKAFMILSIVLTQTLAIFSLGTALNGLDMVLGMFLLIMFTKRMTEDIPISFTVLDTFGLLLLSVIILSSASGSLSSLVFGTFDAIRVLVITFLLCNLVYKKESIYTYVKWLIIVTSISSMIAILQEALYATTGMVIIGMVEEETKKLMYEPTSFGMLLRVPAFTGFYKNFTFLLIPCIIITLGLLAYNVFQDFKTRALLLLSLFLTGTALFLTFSKDSYLAVFLGVLLLIVIRWPYRIIHVSALLLFMPVALYYAGLLDNISNMFSSELHWQEYRIRLQLFRDGVYGYIYRHPWVGVGYRRSPLYTGNFNSWPPHNAILNTGCELGTIGLSVYLLILGYMLLISWSLFLAVTENRDKAITVGLLVGIIADIFSMQFHGTYVSIHLWQFFGIAKAYKIIVDKESVAVRKEPFLAKPGFSVTEGS